MERYTSRVRLRESQPGRRFLLHRRRLTVGVSTLPVPYCDLEPREELVLDTTSSGDQSRQSAGAMGSGTAGRIRRWTGAWLYAAAILLAGGLVAFNILQPITVLPRITPAPGFALTNQAGAVVNSEAQRGRLTLYSFTYSQCNGQCAQSAEQIAATHATLASRLGDDVALDFVTISVDPAYDTPERLFQLKSEVAPGGDEPLSWALLTGDPLRIRMAVGKGFGVYFAEPKVGEGGADTRSVTFDPRYILVDGWGIIRAEYRTAAPDLDTLERDVNLLVSESRNSSGLVKLGYEAAHLFACYPR